MDSRGGVVEAAPPLMGSLEWPEGLREALTGIRGQEGTTLVTDLPSVIVSSILSRIPNPFDVASAFKASRAFWSMAQTAPFRLRLRPSRDMDTGAFGDDSGYPNHRSGNDANKLAAWTRAGLTGIRSVMPCTQELDLAGCPILDDDVTGVLADLRCLECLVLDGCQKLTSSAAHTLALSVRSGPRLLSLQRCFRLGPSAAGNLLAAAATEGAQLQAVLLSHLDGLDLPPQPLVSTPFVLDGSNSRGIEHMEIINKSVGSSDPGVAGLRILALNNCGSLGSPQLAAIAATCPNLEVLMLGGSADGLGLLRLDALPQNTTIEAVSALVGATELLSRLRILELTFFTGSVVRAVREQLSRSIYVWDFCDKNSVAVAAAFVAGLKSPSQSSSGGEDHFLGFPDDLSVGCNIITVSEQDQVESEVCLGLKRDREREGVNDGERVLSKASVSQQGTDRRWEGNAVDVLMALRAGANCSGLRRRTPLHVAAGLGETTVVSNLLSIGAAPRGMKDSGGASALFRAAENGHAHVCDRLLRVGADVLASNRAGETSLYIAALKGHTAAVEVMLQHCQEYGINWQDADVYGDGWTPLMAATVADRQDVGKVLLWAARTSSSSSSSSNSTSTASEDDIIESTESPTDRRSDLLPRPPPLQGPAPQLLDARNRYGQTALHIAARRGFLWFVSNLLRAGASPHIQDDYGLRAIDMARKENHAVVEKLLKEWGDDRKNVNGSTQASKSKNQTRSRKKDKGVAAANKIPAGGDRKNQIPAVGNPKNQIPAVGNPKNQILGGGNAKYQIPEGGNPENQIPRGNSKNQSTPSANRSLSWVPKGSSSSSSSAARSVSDASTPESGSVAESSHSVPELELEQPSLPDSPTSIVPSWLHSSPPLSPQFEHLPATAVERRNDEEDIPELLAMEASHANGDRSRGTQNYWRGAWGTRQRTSSGDQNNNSSTY